MINVFMSGYFNINPFRVVTKHTSRFTIQNLLHFAHSVYCVCMYVIGIHSDYFPPNLRHSLNHKERGMFQLRPAVKKLYQLHPE
jgi:hypothetical protein